MPLRGNQRAFRSPFGNLRMLSQVTCWNILDVCLPIFPFCIPKVKRGSAEGDHKACCLPPQRQILLAWQQSKRKEQPSQTARPCPPPKPGHAARLLRAAPPKSAPSEREVQRGRRPLWSGSPEGPTAPLVGCRGKAPARRRRNRGSAEGATPPRPLVIRTLLCCRRCRGGGRRP